MSAEPQDRGELPLDLAGAAELARAAGDETAARIYEEAAAGAFPATECRGRILAAELAE